MRATSHKHIFLQTLHLYPGEMAMGLPALLRCVPTKAQLQLQSSQSVFIFQAGSVSVLREEATGRAVALQDELTHVGGGGLVARRHQPRHDSNLRQVGGLRRGRGRGGAVEQARHALSVGAAGG